MINEEQKQALIADCKEEIESIKWRMDRTVANMGSTAYLESCLKRQQIALAALTPQPIKLAKYLKLSDRAHQSHVDYAEGYNDRADLDRDAILAAGYSYEVQEHAKQ